MNLFVEDGEGMWQRQDPPAVASVRHRPEYRRADNGAYMGLAYLCTYICTLDARVQRRSLPAETYRYLSMRVPLVLPHSVCRVTRSSLPDIDPGRRCRAPLTPPPATRGGQRLVRGSFNLLRTGLGFNWRPPLFQSTRV